MRAVKSRRSSHKTYPDAQLVGKFLARARDLFAGATADDLAILRTALENVLAASDEAGVLDRATALYDQLPDLAESIVSSLGNAKALYEVLSTAAAEGLAAHEQAAATNANPHHDQKGRFSTAGGNVFRGPDMGGAAGGAYDAETEQKRGELAMQTALDEKTDVLNAMQHPSLGTIDFRWGNSKRGLAYLIARRNAQNAAMNDGITGELVAMKMPGVIAHGSVTYEGRDAVLAHEGFKAILTKGFEGKTSNRWLLNGYDINPGKGRR